MKSNDNKISLIVITSLFFVWGLSNNMTDTLLAAFKRILSMSDFESSWIQIAFYGSYFCLAIPAAIYIKKYTYKSGVLLGLAFFILGSLLFYPASKTMEYEHFLIALFILAGGLAILETTANPFIVALGPEETATRRLNLAQSFNPVGSIVGVLIGQAYILSYLNPLNAHERAIIDKETLVTIQSEELSAVMKPYVFVATVLIVLWFLIYFVKMPRISDSGKGLDFVKTVHRLFRNRIYIAGIIAQFFYVGAQIGIWSFTIRYVMEELEINERQASNYYFVSLIVFMFSRFICTYLMKIIKPAIIMIVLCLIAIISSTIVILIGGDYGVYALIMISGCMSLMYPTIYSFAIIGLAEDTKIASSGLVMSLLGGAILTPIQGWVSDNTQNINFAFVVPLVSFAVVLCYSVYVLRKCSSTNIIE